MSGIIYQVPGKLKGPKGTTYSWRGVDEGDKMPDGWHDSLTGAVEAHLGAADKPKRKRRTPAEMEAARAAEND